MISVPKISVIVPVYKVEKYLDECVQSILKQTYADFELILIDDGSPDRCGEMCDRYAAQDSRVVVVHKENGGVSAARNTALDIARGTYVTFVDSDDSIDERFLEVAIAEIERTNADEFIGGLYMETWNDDGVMINTVCYGNVQSQLYSIKELLEARDRDYPMMCICGPWLKLIRKSIIDQNQLRFRRDIWSGEDTYFNLCIFEHCRHVYFSKECFYHYRRGNADSLFSKFHPDAYEIVRLVYSKMRQLMQRNACDETSMQNFEGLYFELMLGGIHEYYRFSDQTTKQTRLNQIIKVAKDPDIAKTRLSNIKSYKDRIICLLMKCRLYHVISLLFAVKYHRK